MALAQRSPSSRRLARIFFLAFTRKRLALLASFSFSLSFSSFLKALLQVDVSSLVARRVDCEGGRRRPASAKMSLKWNRRLQCAGFQLTQLAARATQRNNTLKSAEMGGPSAGRAHLLACWLAPACCNRQQARRAELMAKPAFHCHARARSLFGLVWPSLAGGN